MAPSTTTSIDFASFHNIVNGQPRFSSSNNHYNGIDPTTKQKLWDVPIANKQDVKDAVEAANVASKKWSKETTWAERQQAILRFKDIYNTYQEEMTELLIAETGKPIQGARLEISSAVMHIDWHGNLSEPEPEKFEDEEKQIATRFLPLGVVAAICPWNFPVFLSLGKILPAILAGNAVIVKPSPFTPYTALKLVEMFQQVVPHGLVQALGGDNMLGPALVAHSDIHKISFTGSVATGKKVLQAAAATLKRVTLELGGNDPCIVLPDVDVAAAAQEIALGSFFNSGQICVATKRIYIHEDIYQPFLDALIACSHHLKVGDPKTAGVMLGPIQNEMQYEKVKGFFADSKNNGYRFAVGKDTVEESKGFFIMPTIIDNPPNDSKIFVEEPFGPIVPCQPWVDEDDVIARANDTRHGLASSVFGKDIQRCKRIAEQLECGSVFINSFAKPSPAIPFGGMKESGIGVEWGKMGILAYLNVQAVHIYNQK